MKLQQNLVITSFYLSGLLFFSLTHYNSPVEDNTLTSVLRFPARSSFGVVVFALIRQQILMTYGGKGGREEGREGAVVVVSETRL